MPYSYLMSTTLRTLIFGVISNSSPSWIPKLIVIFKSLHPPSNAAKHDSSRAWMYLWHVDKWNSLEMATWTVGLKFMPHKKKLKWQTQSLMKNWNNSCWIFKCKESALFINQHGVLFELQIFGVRVLCLKSWAALCGGRGKGIQEIVTYW